MKYTVHVDLDLPRSRVIELFDSPDSLYKWLRGLQEFEPLSGVPGRVGAKSRFTIKSGGRDIEMIETITKRELPDEFCGTYDAKGCHNIVNNRFIELSPDQTRWESENVFEFQGFMKVIGFLFKGSFPKQSLKHMEDFKRFAEDGTDVRD